MLHVWTPCNKHVILWKVINRHVCTVSIFLISISIFMATPPLFYVRSFTRSFVRFVRFFLFLSIDFYYIYISCALYRLYLTRSPDSSSEWPKRSSFHVYSCFVVLSIRTNHTQIYTANQCKSIVTATARFSTVFFFQTHSMREFIQNYTWSKQSLWWLFGLVFSLIFLRLFFRMSL